MGSLGVITGSAGGAAWQQFKISGSEKIWTIPNLCQGDVVALDFTTSAQQNFNANALVTFWVQQVSAGGSLSAPVRLGGAGQIVPWSGANPSPLHLKGTATMAAFNGDPGGSLLVVVRAYMPNNATDTITFFSEAELAYAIMRPNG